MRIGSTDRTQGGEEIEIAEITEHDGGILGHDIALIKLAEPAESTPIEIGTEAPVGTESRVLGWGQTKPEPGADDGPDILKELDTSVVDPDTGCRAFDDETELCTESPDDQGVCYGDSGGPQITKEDGQWVLIGVASRLGRGPTCAVAPSVYTNVVAHADWIEENSGVGR